VLWSGLRKPINFKNRLILQVKRHRVLKARARVWKHWIRGQAYKRFLGIHVPSPWDFIIFRKRVPTLKRSKHRLVFIYSSIYYCMCPLPLQWRTLYQNRFNPGVNITARQYSHYTITYFTKFYDLFFSLHRPLFRKLKFKGKGYYMYRNHRNTITPQLGHAHRILTYTFYLTVRFFRRGTTRRSILLTGRLKEHLHVAAWRIKQMRRQNIFTGRGVRFARGRIYRKPGKISTYR
jgi:hypothetical protein